MGNTNGNNMCGYKLGDGDSSFCMVIIDSSANRGYHLGEFTSKSWDMPPGKHVTIAYGYVFAFRWTCK